MCERLDEARLNVVRNFERAGLELFVEPAEGMFVWARLPHVEDAVALAEAAQRDGIMLAPGAVFRPHLERSPWMRFNVARLRRHPRAALAAAAGERRTTAVLSRRSTGAAACRTLSAIDR